MMSLLSTVGIAVVVFVTTDIDDLLVLSVFFADRRLSARAVVLGQFLGIAVLFAIGAAAALLALAVPDEWVALLGVVPLVMGLIGIWRLARGNDDDDEEAAATDGARRAEARTHSPALAVAAVTIANGGDNLGVYVPLFARDVALLPVYGAVFAVMTGLWCLLGYRLVVHPVGAAIAQRWGHLIVPFVLLGVGLHVLWDARALLHLG